jgi:hypothetical protein
VGSIRRECLDFLIPLNEKHLRRTLKQWVDHYNRGRPPSRLGPEIPDPPENLPQKASSRYRIPQDHRVVTKPIMGGCITNMDSGCSQLESGARERQRGLVANHNEVPKGFLIKKKSILGGLHHEYQIDKVVA